MRQARYGPASSEQFDYRYKASRDLDRAHPGYASTTDGPVAESDGGVSVAAEGGAPLAIGDDGASDERQFDIQRDSEEEQTEAPDGLGGVEESPARTTFAGTKGDGRDYFGAAGKTIWKLQHDREVAVQVSCDDHETHHSNCSNCETLESETGEGSRMTDKQIRRARLGTIFSQMSAPDTLRDDLKAIVLSTSRSEWGAFSRYGGGFEGLTVGYLAYLHCDNREDAEEWAEVRGEPPLDLTEDELFYAVKYAFEKAEDRDDASRVESVAETWRTGVA